MSSLAHVRRYLPHEPVTRQKTVDLLLSGEEIQIIVRRYRKAAAFPRTAHGDRESDLQTAKSRSRLTVSSVTTVVPTAS